jgi:hypothetical protein
MASTAGCLRLLPWEVMGHSFTQDKTPGQRNMASVEYKDTMQVIWHKVVPCRAVLQYSIHNPKSEGPNFATGTGERKMAKKLDIMVCSFSDYDDHMSPWPKPKIRNIYNIKQGNVNTHLGTFCNCLNPKVRVTSSYHKWNPTSAWQWLS